MKCSQPLLVHLLFHYILPPLICTSYLEAPLRHSFPSLSRTCWPMGCRGREMEICNIRQFGRRRIPGIISLLQLRVARAHLPILFGDQVRFMLLPPRGALHCSRQPTCCSSPAFIRSSPDFCFQSRSSSSSRLFLLSRLFPTRSGEHNPLPV